MSSSSGLSRMNRIILKKTTVSQLLDLDKKEFEVKSAVITIPYVTVST